MAALYSSTGLRRDGIRPTGNILWPCLDAAAGGTTIGTNILLKFSKSSQTTIP